MRRLSVLALLLAALVVSALPAWAAAEKDHFQAHLKAVGDTNPEGTNPQGQANFWFSEEIVDVEKGATLVIRCTMTGAAVYDMSTIRLQYRNETVMRLLTLDLSDWSEGYIPGRLSGQAIKNASPYGTPYYTDLALTGMSMENLRQAMREGEIYVSIFAGPEVEAVEILSGKVR